MKEVTTMIESYFTDPKHQPTPEQIFGIRNSEGLKAQDILNGIACDAKKTESS